MKSRNLAVLLLGFDVIATIAVFNLIGFLRGAPNAQLLIVTPLLVPAAVLVLAVYLIEGYRAQTDMLSVDYASLHVIALGGALISTLLLTYVFIPTGYELQSSRLVIAFSYLALVPLTLAYRRLIYLRRIATRGQRGLVFLGNAASFQAFREESARMSSTQPILFAEIAPEPAADLDPAQPASRPIAAVLDEVSAGTLSIEAIVLRETAGEMNPEISRRLMQLYFVGIPTYTLERFHQVYWRKIPLYRLNQAWLFQEGFRVAREPVFERLKRASDIGLAFIGLLLGALPVAAAAIAIWLEDRGPVFFTQTRIGKNHAPFRLVKLRTMRTAASSARYTEPNDKRITRVGSFLRKTRLDELPQLWNVLRGEMSLIGPRAEWDRLVADYEREIPCYHFRHLVKPGITGWAQVNYPYGASVDDTLRKLEYDLYYIRHFSFLLDASIVLKTVHITLFGRGR